MAETLTNSLDEKEQLLVKQLSKLDGVIVAYSGGVDSSLLAYYARNLLNEKAKIAIGVSPILPAEELEAARLQAEQFNFDLIEVDLPEIENPDYRKNDDSRCYYCKSTLFLQLEALARESDIKYIAFGAIMEDMQDARAGNRAAREHRILSPLQQAGLEKWEIRQLALRAGLPSWDRPQAACLSSRIPLNEPVTVEKLSLIEKSESYLHTLGFRQLRVRHHGEIARIELARSEMPKLCNNVELMAQVSDRLKEFGYRFVTLDLAGYRGSADLGPGNTP
jgi:pyridinium-3,5-biscarboxylic acid mononucleotide sulfurtransferase